MSATTHHTLEDILTNPPRSRLRDIGRVVMGIIGCFILWGMFAELEEVAVAPGEVVPQEQIQSVQHLEGGIIEKIYVFEGDRVKKDQPLIQLNITPFVANKQESEINLQGLMLKQARLEAESEGKKEFALGDEAKKYRPELIKSEQQAFVVRRNKLESSLGVLKEQVQQKQLDVQQLETERSSTSNNLALLREKLRISTDLVRDKLTSKLDHLELAGQVKELEGRLNVVNVAIPRSEAALSEANERLNNEELTFRNQAAEELSQVSIDIAKTREILNRATDQVTRTTLKSPIDGTVKSLKTHTIGGVVQPGEIVMEIVPESKNLIIEAKLNPNDIGFVRKGQKALVKIMTYDYARYGGLNGEVISVSADSHTDRSRGGDASYFLVKVRTGKGYLGNKAGMLPITPGMVATVDIHTGEKSVMEYLLKPIIKVQEEAFRER